MALHCTLARRHALWKLEPKNIQKPPRVLTKTLHWPKIPQKLATVLVLKTCQLFTSVPNGTSGCVWKRGIPITIKLNQKARWVSTCAPQSQEFLELCFLVHALSMFATYLPILPSLIIFPYLTDEGHRSDRNVLLLKDVLISVNAVISFYIMPDYNHGTF